LISFGNEETATFREEVSLFLRRKDLDHSLIQSYLTEALLQLMGTKNFSDISVGEIAERAGVHRATFYRHFSSKDEVLRCALARMLRETEGDRKLLETDFASFIRPVFQAFFDNKNQMLRLYKAGLSGQILDVLKEYFHFEEIPDMAVNGGDGDGASGTGENINMEKYRMAYRTGGIYSCLLLWFSHDMRETPEEMTEIAVSL
jgi:AcrR family transcriptional regulator